MEQHSHVLRKLTFVFLSLRERSVPWHGQTTNSFIVGSVPFPSCRMLIPHVRNHINLQLNFLIQTCWRETLTYCRWLRSLGRIKEKRGCQINFGSHYHTWAASQVKICGNIFLNFINPSLAFCTAAVVAYLPACTVTLINLLILNPDWLTGASTVQSLDTSLFKAFLGGKTAVKTLQW